MKPWINIPLKVMKNNDKKIPIQILCEIQDADNNTCHNSQNWSRI